jgi:RimJ/RimL family protein N-acetyltransferase
VAPLLETARLRLRAFRASDLELQAAILGDPDVMRFVGGEPANREETWRKMLGNPGLWEFLGYGYWAVERLDDGMLLGQVGFADYKRDVQPSIEGIPEVGWMFAPWAWGQGYATEAVSAALRWGDETLGGEFVAVIDPRNEPSKRLARRLGFLDAGGTMYHEDPILLFRRPARLPAAASASTATAA